MARDRTIPIARHGKLAPIGRYRCIESWLNEIGRHIFRTISQAEIPFTIQRAPPRRFAAIITLGQREGRIGKQGRASRELVKRKGLGQLPGFQGTGLQ